MHFYSDNVATVHPDLWAAMRAADRLDHGYDGDGWSRRLDAAFTALLGAEVAVLWVTTGTAANALALASLCPPYGGVICHRESHVQVDEAGAPEFYTHGAKLMLVDGDGAKVHPDAVTGVLDSLRADVHQVQAHAVSISNATEYGLVYRPDEVAALGQLCAARGLGLHMDGARFANAVAFLGCDPAALTHRAGVDVLSFGCIKNGGMSAEALIFFDPAQADAARIRRKRGGHLSSKGRYQAAQLLAMVEDGLWLANAQAANAAAQQLASVVADRLLYPVEANELFMRLSAAEAATLRAQGFGFYDWGPGAARLVTRWDQDQASVDMLTTALRDL